MASNNSNNRNDFRTFDLYVVQESATEGGKPFWAKVGGGYENRDGSQTLKLTMFPGLTLQCREHVPFDDSNDNGRGNRRSGGRG